MNLSRTRCLVLGAGRGRRMGAPKALMNVSGRAWWSIQHERLRQVGAPVIWVVSHEILSGLAPDAGFPEPFVEAEADAPMFDSLIAGLRSLQGDAVRGVFVLPVDVPAAERAVWSALASMGTPAVPTYGGVRGHPVYLPSSWVKRRILEAELSRTQRRLDHLLRGEAVTIGVRDPVVGMNLNTPADVQRFLETLPPDGKGRPRGCAAG